MVEQTGSRHRSEGAIAFERYVRTGIRSSARSRSIEVKFNPWHDPANGRFTFSGQGRYFGAGSAASADAPGSQRRPHANAADDPNYSRFDPRDPRNRTIYVVKPGDSLTKIAQLRKGLKVDDLAWLNGLSKDAPLPIGRRLMLPTQRYLDAGRDARNRAFALDLYMRTHGGRLPPDAAHPPSLEQQIGDRSQWRPIGKNGYRFDIDLIERSREIRGALSGDGTSTRSRRNQRSAGGADRRPSDDGGHYIAVRFNGPSEAFNHFAQDASFNRGAYRALEDEWARDLREGHRVAVDIVPLYNGLSQRPYALSITWFVDGERQFKRLPNGKRGEHDGG